jgi:Ras association domain-containing protein 2/4
MKLKTYNQFYNTKSLEVKSREINGRIVLEGALRIYWGIQGVIHLKEDDDQRTVVTIRKRHSVRYPNSVDIVSSVVSSRPFMWLTNFRHRFARARMELTTL